MGIAMGSMPRSPSIRPLGHSPPLNAIPRSPPITALSLDHRQYRPSPHLGSSSPLPIRISCTRPWSTLHWTGATGTVRTAGGKLAVLLVMLPS